MIRTPADTGLGRRQLLRSGFLGVAGLAAAEVFGLVAPFLRVTRVEGLGASVVAGRIADILDEFARTDDRPIVNVQGRFFLLHPPGGIVAAYRKCTHLGCAVPFNASEDRFHCPCHGSIFDKRTAVVIRDPAPKPLALFHVRDEAGALVVDTNPLTAIDRQRNQWDPAHLEVRT